MKILILVCTSFLLAQDKPFELDPSIKENLKAIKEIHQDKKVQKLAQTLNLSPDQIQKLKAVKVEINKIHELATPEFNALQDRMATTAEQLRQVLENNGTDETLVQELKTIRNEMKTWRKKLRLNLQIAALDLEGLLEPNQIKALRELGERKPKQKRSGKHSKRRLAKILLSDAFLDQFPD